MTPQEAVKAVESATVATILLGSKPEQRHRELKILLHPDRFATDTIWMKRAEAAIYKLDTLLAAVLPKPPTARPVKVGKWIIGDPIAKGDIADLYRADSVDGSGILKIAQSARDNDLIKNEREVLGLLHRPTDKASIQFRRYIPSLLDGFSASGRAANVISAANGFLALADICKLVTVDFRHVVWMMNRSLSVLWLYPHARRFPWRNNANASFVRSGES